MLSLLHSVFPLLVCSLRPNIRDKLHGQFGLFCRLVALIDPVPINELLENSKCEKDYFHNDINPFEKIPGTSIASI